MIVAIPSGGFDEDDDEFDDGNSMDHDSSMNELACQEMGNTFMLPHREIDTSTQARFQAFALLNTFGRFYMKEP